jgi:hypothetical protein
MGRHVIEDLRQRVVRPSRRGRHSRHAIGSLREQLDERCWPGAEVAMTARHHGGVTSSVWLKRDHELVPGSEIFRSERRFNLEAYTASHGQLLLRSNPVDEEYETTIDLLFKPVEALKARDGFDGLVISCASDEEASEVVASIPGFQLRHDDRVFILRSQGRSDYVVSMAVGWHEGILPRMQAGFFNTADAYLPRWPTEALFGVNAGFNVASVDDLVAALRSDDDQPARRERFRQVFVVMTDVGTPAEPKTSGSGVFLTRADAEEAHALLEPQVTRCWIETLPIVI